MPLHGRATPPACCWSSPTAFPPRTHVRKKPPPFLSSSESRFTPVALGHYRLAEQMRQVHEGGYNRQGVMSDGARNRLARLEDREREIMEFASLGELTGGRSFNPREINLGIMRQILGAMAGQIRCEYVVGFTPALSPEQPKQHKLQVKLRSKDLGKVLGGVRTVTH